MTGYQKPEELPGDFGFQVGHDHSGRCDGETPWVVVQLPHQCDEWAVTCTKDKADAIARMERFVSEAQAALAKLREL